MRLPKLEAIVHIDWRVIPKTIYRKFYDFSYLSPIKIRGNDSVLISKRVTHRVKRTARIERTCLSHHRARVSE